MMECQRAGLPVVASANGALPETLDADAGFLIPGFPGEPAHDDAFVDSVMQLIQDDASV
jgi:glycosyltransferase involved in cell wall biosynthesis